ncbi:3'-5' exoribonuclease YhaM family protein [Candidatus Neomarinimicrobiota bacterium]
MKKIRTINSFSDGDKIQGFFLCTEKHLRYTKTRDIYIDLVLRDRTGKISAKIWDRVSEYKEKFSEGEAVVVAGTVETFLEKLQLVINRINRASVKTYGRYGYDPALVVPTSEFDPRQMWKELSVIIRKIKNPFLRNLVKIIYSKNKSKILVHPASIVMHHNYRSGYLEHVLSMAKIGLTLGPHYNVEQDLLITGILLHDVGKLVEITSDLESRYSDEGNFIGHIVIGRDMVRDTAKEIKKFPGELLLKLEHIILSHQGQYEWESPKKPKFQEALLVHLIDNLDAKMELMKSIIDDDIEEGGWTNRRNYFRIPIYKGSDESK